MDNDIDSSLTIVPLYWRGTIVLYSLVDSVDVEELLLYDWSLLKDDHRPTLQYAYREDRPLNGGVRMIYMHREIMGLPRQFDGRQVDHKNRHGLDNRRENLRIVTNAENSQNRASCIGSKSKYRGVCWNQGRWRAVVTVQGHRHYLGSFTCEEEAHQAAVAGRLRLMPFTIEASELK